MERTLGIIKPDAVARNLTGEILKRVESSGLRVVGLRMLWMNKQQAEGFYHVHEKRPFFSSLTAFMSEGPIVVMVLEGSRAIQRWREVMGATDPSQAAVGTIREALGENIERNSVHGSDSPASAAFEIGYFFNALEVTQ
jgi:nucleoside-diphosphate kinase